MSSGEVFVTLTAVRERVYDVPVFSEPAPKQRAQWVVIFNDENAHMVFLRRSLTGSISGAEPSRR